MPLVETNLTIPVCEICGKCGVIHLPRGRTLIDFLRNVTRDGFIFCSLCGEQVIHCEDCAKKGAELAVIQKEAKVAFIAGEEIKKCQMN